MAETYDEGEVRRPLVTERRVDYGTPDTEALLLRDRVRWGPILAGLLTTITTMLVLTVLGLAIGLSAFEPNDAGDGTIGTSAAIWGAVSALVAFLLGGLVAAKSSAVAGAPSGALNGLMVGVAAISLILALIGAGLGNLFGAVGSNLGDIANLSNQINAPDVDAGEAARAAYDDARNGAWGTLIALLLALGAATLGGVIGHNEREDVIENVGPAPTAGRTRARG